ncbi:protein-L-isoaspartate O-methyltransferase [Alphaproteobacteria bacterium LSUCC0684]
MSVFEDRRRLMVESQLRTNKVTDIRVLEAFEEVPREKYVGRDTADLAYIDEDLMLDGGRFILEPMVFARMVQALELKPADIVLDLGAALGYSTAILSRFVQSVVGIESHEEIAARGQSNLIESGVDNAVVLHADLTEGFRAESPYNAIIIEGSVSTVPDAVLGQLAEDGRCVTILRDAPNGPGRVVKYVRAGNSFAHSVLFDAYSPFLPEFATEKGFDFAV